METRSIRHWTIFIITIPPDSKDSNIRYLIKIKSIKLEISPSQSKCIFCLQIHLVSCGKPACRGPPPDETACPSGATWHSRSTPRLIASLLPRPLTLMSVKRSGEILYPVIRRRNKEEKCFVTTKKWGDFTDGSDFFLVFELPVKSPLSSLFCCCPSSALSKCRPFAEQ